MFYVGFFRAKRIPWDFLRVQEDLGANESEPGLEFHSSGLFLFVPYSPWTR